MRIDQQTKDAVEMLRETSRQYNVGAKLHFLRTHKKNHDLPFQQTHLVDFACAVRLRMKKLGFTKIRSDMHVTSWFVFMGDNFVVKANYVVGRKPRNCVPTWCVNIGGLIWRIQPKCEPLGVGQKADVFKITEYGGDPHKRNVMIYKGKPVVVDW